MRYIRMLEKYLPLTQSMISWILYHETYVVHPVNPGKLAQLALFDPFVLI